MRTGTLFFQFFYDISLSLILMGLVSIAFCLWVIQRKGVAVPVMGYFACCLIDTIIIFMTEAIPEFAVWYEQGFVYSPALKTLVFVGNGFFVLSAWNAMTGKRFGINQCVLLVLLGVYLELITLMPNSALRVWLYFLAYQVFSITICILGFNQLQKMEETTPMPKKLLKRLLWATLGFSVLILLEDTVVIFFFDSYQLSSLSIYNRNVSEDILRLYYAAFFLKFFTQCLVKFREDEVQAVQPVEKNTVESPASAPVPAPTPAQEQFIPVDATDYKRIKFGRSIALSERELEVFLLVLEGRSNQEIGETLCISKGTVKAHIHNIFQKADVTQRRELLMKFEEFEIVT